MEDIDLLEALQQRPDALVLIDQFKLSLQSESERRVLFYETVTEDDKAEFINGHVILHSPVKSGHWMGLTSLVGRLIPYVKTNDLGYIGIEKVMISLSRNDYEPDIVFFSKDKANQFTPDQMLFPAPDFVVEILSPSTEKNDRNIKFIDYAAHGIQEYLIVDTQQRTIEQYTLEGHKYELLHKLVETDPYRSNAISGFEMQLAEIFN